MKTYLHILKDFDNAIVESTVHLYSVYKKYVKESGPEINLDGLDDLDGANESKDLFKFLDNTPLSEKVEDDDSQEPISTDEDPSNEENTARKFAGLDEDAVPEDPEGLISAEKFFTKRSDSDAMKTESTFETVSADDFLKEGKKKSKEEPEETEDDSEESETPEETEDDSEEPKDDESDDSEEITTTDDPDAGDVVSEDEDEKIKKFFSGDTPQTQDSANESSEELFEEDEESTSEETDKPEETPPEIEETPPETEEDVEMTEAKKFFEGIDDDTEEK